jgi:ketosteroid isomerase-like protein
MMDAKASIERAYAAFNARDIDGVLELMTEDVSWPKASEGGRAEGKEEIRTYWTRQWKEFDPRVEPAEIAEVGVGGAKFRVRVRQRVKNLQGDVLAEGEVVHVYTMRDGLIAAMHIGDEAEAGSGASAAFAHRK